MAEEIKQTFRGRREGLPGSVFVGCASSLTDGVLHLHGVFLPDIKGPSSSIALTSADKLPDDSIGLTKVKDLEHIKPGDFLTVKSGFVRSIFRPYSNHNSIFATVRCNSNCLMCSQPPLDVDDVEENYLVWKWLIDEIPSDTTNLGVTGGEPMLMGEMLVDLLNNLTDRFPSISIDVLSNGRLQALPDYVKILSKVNNPSRIVFAIPLYSDYYRDHDHIVQAKDAFYQTILGIHNMAALNFRIEIRVVLHKLSLPRLDKLASYIHRNLPFVWHITFMGLEIIGYTKANKNQLLIDSQEFLNSKLSQAVNVLKPWNYSVSIYNTPFCFLQEDLRPYARQSISDWKNSFHEDCERCDLKESCAGFFSWNLEYVRVNPIALSSS